MPHFLGIDIGTSAVKAVLVDAGQAVLCEASVPLAVSRPRPLWSEQNAEDWWRAVEGALAALAREAPQAMGAVAALGLSGQMHGAALLDAGDRLLRPVMLWNDGRAFAEAAELAAAHPELAAEVGIPPMAGFTAPMLLWLRRHEPGTFGRIRRILNAKDYVRLRLAGELATDPSDAAGTWWLDEARRDWSAAALAACGIDRAVLPPVVEGSRPTGTLRPDVAARFGLPPGVVVAAGAGDTAAGAIGIGVIGEGTAQLSLGTSASMLAGTASYRPAPERLVHAFCHGLPGRWFQMAAMLNGASCLAWAAGLAGVEPGAFAAEIEAAYAAPGALTFLPYLSGERTPHDDPHAKGVLFGLTPGVGRLELGQAVMEGVAMSFADAQDCLAEAGTDPARFSAIGGGARSRLWVRMLAAVLDRPIVRHRGGDKGPAFGAARLARLALTGEPPETVCIAPPVLDVTEPERDLVDAYRPRVERFRRLYRALREEFRRG